MNEPILLHLELRDDYLSDEDKVILKRYGEVNDNYVISRDILVPSDMPLNALHFAIQRTFGWQNSHLRRFQLPNEDFKRVTKGRFKGWADLVGNLFQISDPSKDW